jgi:hypothetical protein
VIGICDIFDFLEAGLVRGVVDKDIDPAEFRDRLANDGPAVAGVLNIARKQNSSAAM